MTIKQNKIMNDKLLNLKTITDQLAARRREELNAEEAERQRQERIRADERAVAIRHALDYVKEVNSVTRPHGISIELENVHATPTGIYKQLYVCYTRRGEPHEYELLAFRFNQQCDGSVCFRYQNLQLPGGHPASWSNNDLSYTDAVYRQYNF